MHFISKNYKIYKNIGSFLMPLQQSKLIQTYKKLKEEEKSIGGASGGKGAGSPKPPLFSGGAWGALIYAFIFKNNTSA